MSVPLIIALAAVGLMIGSESRASTLFDGTRGDADGVVKAFVNRIPLQSGDKWALDFDGDNLVNYALDDRAAYLVKRGHSTVDMTLADARNLMTQALNMTGFGAAQEVHVDGKTIVLNARLEQANIGPSEPMPSFKQWHHADRIFVAWSRRKTIRAKMKIIQMSALMKSASNK